MTLEPPSLLSLPLEIMDEILKRMDLNSIKNISQTCKFFKDKVDTFKLAYPEVMWVKIAEQRAYIDCASDNDDDYDLNGDHHEGSGSDYEPADDIEALIDSFNDHDFDIERGDWEDDEDY